MKKFITVTLLLCLLASTFAIGVSAANLSGTEGTNLIDSNAKISEHTGFLVNDQGEYEPKYLIDYSAPLDADASSFGYRWIPDTTPGSFTLDLGSAKKFNKFMTVEARDRIEGYTIEVSTDGSTWTTAATGKNFPKSESYFNEDGTNDVDKDPLVIWQSVEFDAVTARYLKFTVTDVHTANPSLWRIELYDTSPAEEAPASAAETSVEAVPEAAPAPAPAQTTAPQTADPITLIALGSLISAAGVVIARKRK